MNIPQFPYIIMTGLLLGVVIWFYTEFAERGAAALVFVPKYVSKDRFASLSDQANKTDYYNSGF